MLIQYHIISFPNSAMCMRIPACLRCPKFPTSSLTVASTDGTSWTSFAAGGMALRLLHIVALCFDILQSILYLLIKLQKW